MHMHAFSARETNRAYARLSVGIGADKAQKLRFRVIFRAYARVFDLKNLVFDSAISMHKHEKAVVASGYGAWRGAKFHSVHNLRTYAYLSGHSQKDAAKVPQHGYFY